MSFSSPRSIRCDNLPRKSVQRRVRPRRAVRVPVRRRQLLHGVLICPPPFLRQSRTRFVQELLSTSPELLLGSSTALGALWHDGVSSGREKGMRPIRRAALLGAVACGLLLSATALAGVAAPAPAIRATASTPVVLAHDDDLRRHPAVNPALGRRAGTVVPHAGHDHLVSGGVGIGRHVGSRSLPADRLRPRPGGLASGIQQAAEGLGSRGLRGGCSVVSPLEQ